MKKETLIYILLFVLTSITLLLGETALSGITFIVIVLVTSLLKGSLIIDYFMELKNVSFGYRFVVIFVVICCSFSNWYCLHTTN